MMKNKLCTFALVLGLTPLAMFAPAASAQDRDRDDRQQGTWSRNNDLQNTLHQRVPNSNIAVNWRNNNTVVLTGTAASDRDRQAADQLVRSQVGNAQVIDQVTVNGYNSAYPNGTYANGDRDRDRDNRTDADRDRARTDNDRAQSDNDRDDQVRRNDSDDHRQMRDNDRDHVKKHKDKDKDKKDKDKKDRDDRGDHDSDNRPH